MAWGKLAGMVLDAALLGVLVILTLSAPSKGGGGYFDVRGADIRGIYATYVGTVRRGFDAWLTGKAAMREGGYLNFSGKLIYTTSKFFILYDPINNRTFSFSDDFTYRFADGIPVQTRIYPSEEDGYDLVTLRLDHSADGPEAEDLATMCSILRELGAVECFVSAESGFLVGEEYGVPGSLVTDVVSEEGVIFLSKTAGKEAVVSYIFSPVRSVVKAEAALSSVMSERYGLINHFFHADTILVLIRHGADVEAIGVVASEYGLRLVEMMGAC